MKSLLLVVTNILGLALFINYGPGLLIVRLVLIESLVQNGTILLLYALVVLL